MDTQLQRKAETAVAAFFQSIYGVSCPVSLEEDAIGCMLRIKGMARALQEDTEARTRYHESETLFRAALKEAAGSMAVMKGYEAISNGYELLDRDGIVYFTYPDDTLGQSINGLLHSLASLAPRR